MLGPGFARGLLLALASDAHSCMMRARLERAYYHSLTNVINRLLTLTVPGRE